MKRKQVTRVFGREALRLAEGLFSHTVDIGLWLIIYAAALSVPQSQYGQVRRAAREADRFLDQVNAEVIKNAIQTARKRGWIKIVKRKAASEITMAGMRRLQAMLPQYDDTRVWDSRMHMVTYDVPETKRKGRRLLREYLKTIGCGILQESVWVTPYNPIDTLRDFIETHGLKGNIIVSDMGKDGSIGEEDVRAMIVRVYKLEALNDRYLAWMESVEDYGEADHLSIIQYLAILKDDPQLPFTLLPSWWKGDSAYQMAQSKLEKVVNLLPTGQILTT